MIDINSKAATVSFRNVTKMYGSDVTAIDNINLEIEAGKLVTLLGPSGCGKTTTLRMVAGLEMATKGQIFIGDVEVTNLPATDRDVSMVFQSYALFPHMTVLENVSYGLGFSGFNKSETRERAHAGLDLVGLKGYSERLPSALSGGQQQRVAVARALVLEPQVLLFDEPLSNLDAKLRRQVREELYDTPADTFVADFIGEANLLPCEVTAVSGGVAHVSLGDFQTTLPSRGVSQGAAIIAIRPSRLMIGAANGFKAVVNKATYVGSRMEYTLVSGFSTMFAVQDDVDNPITIGQEVIVGFSKTGPVLLPIT